MKTVSLLVAALASASVSFNVYCTVLQCTMTTLDCGGRESGLAAELNL